MTVRIERGSDVGGLRRVRYFRLLMALGAVAGILAMGAPAARGQSKPEKSAPTRGALETLYIVDEDATLYHEPWGEDEVSFLPGVPRDWTTPINYADGTIHMRIEVTELQKPFLFMFMLNNEDPKFKDSTWSIYTANFSKPEVITKSVPVKSAMIGDGGPHWHQIAYWCFIIQRSLGDHVRGDPAWYPIRIRFKAAVVPKGGTLDLDFWSPYGRYGALHWKDVTELKTVATHLRAGAIGKAIQEAGKETASRDPKRSQEAKRVLEALKSYVEKRRKELGETRLESPDFALRELSELAKRCVPSEIGKNLGEEAKAWTKDPQVAKARKAKAIFEAVREAASELAGKGKATDPKFAAQHARQIQTIAAGASKLVKEHSDTKFSREAAKIADERGIRLDP